MYKLKCFEVVNVKLNIFQLDCDCIKLAQDYLSVLATAKNTIY